MSLRDDDAAEVLAALRQELAESGYGAILADHDVEFARRELTPAVEIRDLVVRLRVGVIPALLAHAASIRNLQPKPGPRGPLWESPPRAYRSEQALSEDDFVLVLDQGEGDRLQRLAVELDGMLRDLEDEMNADET